MALRDWVKKVKGLRSTSCKNSYKNSHADVKCRLENIGNNIVITLVSDRYRPIRVFTS